jgi:hypothetical protein
MEPLMINDIWYEKEATPYEGVTARIDAVIGGTVITHKQFRLNFDHGQQFCEVGSRVPVAYQLPLPKLYVRLSPHTAFQKRYLLV